jgi:thioredoxin-like negative regulator of GroEL
LNAIDPERVVAPADEAMQALFREIDVYVAYGRFDDAATRLEQAIEEAPTQFELRAKLGEILDEAGDAERYVELTRSLYLRLQGAGDESLWARIALLGQRLAPDERVFQQSLATPAVLSPEVVYGGVDELAERRGGQG